MAIRRKSVVDAETKTKRRVSQSAVAAVVHGDHEAAPAEALQPGPHIQQDEGVIMARLCRYAEGVVLHESTTEHRVPSPKFEGEVARTRVSMGVTKSLGGFEFARLDIMVELPCYPNPTDLDETNQFAATKVSEFMDRELASILPPPLPHVEGRTDTSALTNGDN